MFDIFYELCLIPPWSTHLDNAILSGRRPYDYNSYCIDDICSVNEEGFSANSKCILYFVNDDSRHLAPGRVIQYPQLNSGSRSTLILLSFRNISVGNISVDVSST